MTLFKDVKIVSPSLHLNCGMPGSGKTVLSFDIADRIHAATGKNIYVVESEGQRGLPDGVPDHVKGFCGADYPLDSIVILDDAQLEAHARRFGSSFNVEFDKLHSTLRHDNIDYILDSQTLKAVDVNNVLRSNYRWYKKPYELDMKLGRPEIKRELEEAESLKLSKTEAYLAAETYDYSFKGRVTGIPLPKYWSPDMSTMHRRDPGLVVQVKRRLRIY